MLAGSSDLNAPSPSIEVSFEMGESTLTHTKLLGGLLTDAIDPGRIASMEQTMLRAEGVQTTI